MKTRSVTFFSMIAFSALCQLIQGCSTCRTSDWIVNSRAEDIIPNRGTSRVLIRDVEIVNESATQIYETYTNKVFIGDGTLLRSSRRAAIPAGTKMKISGIIEIRDKLAFCFIPIPLARTRNRYVIFFYEDVGQSVSWPLPRTYAFVVKRKNDIKELPFSIATNY